ncbi:MAG: TetR/AcrR family transcriptional regulator [Acidimicrobiales bacterium]
MKDLRQRLRDTTRRAIVGAYLDLSHRDGQGQVSIPAVADRAGVSVRTVYRYFATKDDLQTEAAYHYARRAERAMADRQLDAASFDDYLRHLWRDFATQLPAVIAEHATPAGRELRSTRLAHSRALVRHAVPGADDDQVDLMIAITSSSMFLELVDRMGHEPDKAVELVTGVIRLILADADADADAGLEPAPSDDTGRTDEPHDTEPSFPLRPTR